MTDLSTHSAAHTVERRRDARAELEQLVGQLVNVGAMSRRPPRGVAQSFASNRRGVRRTKLLALLWCWLFGQRRAKSIDEIATEWQG